MGQILFQCNSIFPRTEKNPSFRKNLAALGQFFSYSSTIDLDPHHMNKSFEGFFLCMLYFFNKGSIFYLSSSRWLLRLYWVWDGLRVWLEGRFAPTGPNVLVLWESFVGLFASCSRHQWISFAELGCWLEKDIVYYPIESMRASGNYEGIYE